MAPPPLTSCLCDHEELSLRELKLLKLVALYEEALSKPQPPPGNFLLNTQGGVLLWSLASGFIILFIQHIFWILSKVRAAWKALLKINNNRLQRQGGSSLQPSSNDEIDTCEAAMVFVGEVQCEGTSKDDVENGLKEVRLRVQARVWMERTDALSDTAVPPTKCDDIANKCSSVSGSSSLSSENTVNSQLGVTVHLPHTTLESDEEKEEFIAQASDILPKHSQDLILIKGSTFLSATVSVSASKMHQLLHCATCLVKMGLSYDSACTVQFGNIALLYGKTETGDNVERAFLSNDVHVPHITSAKGFHKRTIVIKGIYLENAEIKATTESYGESTLLHVLYFQKLEKGIEMLLVQLPTEGSLKERIYVHAQKIIQLEGYTSAVTLTSNVKMVDIIKQKYMRRMPGILCTWRLWICVLILYGCHILIVSPWQFLPLEWMLVLPIWLLCYFLVDSIIGPRTYRITIRCLELMMRLWISTKLTDSKLEIALKNHSISKHIQTDVDVNNPNWEWPCFERIIRGGGWVTQKVNANVELDSAANMPFQVVTTIYSFNGSKSVEINVFSPHLIRVLRDSKPQTGTQFEAGSAIEPQELFLRLESLKHYVSTHDAVGEAESSDTTLWQVKHLVRFVESHFSDALVHYKRMKAEKCVSFDLLWAFFVPGEGVCRRCLVTNEECFATVKSRPLLKTDENNILYYSLKLNVMDFNVQSYYKCTMVYKIPSFDGEVPFTSLQACPLRFFPNRKQLEDRYLSHGAIFYQLAMQQPFRFMQFKGSMNFYDHNGSCWVPRKLNADGRVMVDLLCFARMNPDFPLGNAKPPCEVMTGRWTPTSQMKKPSDEELMLAPAFVYGFSFRLKRWGCFELCGLEDIRFNGGAFDALTMKDESQKMILRSLMDFYIERGAGSRFQNEQNIDPIANKGKGCIVLCHGPPGTGKTLTAEALAETMQCPLWSISAFELGNQPDIVETRLVQILEISNTWHAVLLLDEADAYLQRRDEGVDVQRNLLTGVFLRVLEYHQGIMFLTTNRVTVFDDAILSRTTLIISYPALEETQRREIWKNVLQRAGIHNVTYDALLHHDFNGRQIRNIVHLAKLLADGRKHNLGIVHVIEAINASISGTKGLPVLAAST